MRRCSRPVSVKLLAQHLKVAEAVAGARSVPTPMSSTASTPPAAAFTPAGSSDVVEEGIRRYVTRFPRMAKKLGVEERTETYADVAADTVIVKIVLGR